MSQTPPEVLLNPSSPKPRERGFFENITGVMREVTAGAVMSVGPVLGLGVSNAQEVPPTYEHATKLTRKLGNDPYIVRAKTEKRIQELFKDEDIAHRMMIWMAPEKDRGDLETTRRIQEFERLQITKSMQRYPVKFDDDWIDGANFDKDGCDARLPPLWSGAEFLNRYQMSRLYLHKAQKRGAKSTGSPDWEQYRVGHQILAEELRDYYGRDELWNADARKAFNEWNQKNPKGDKGKWLLDRFDERVEKGVLPKIEETLKYHKRGSETYRKNSNIPLKRPMGPLLRSDILDPATIAIVQPEKKLLKKAG